MRGAGGPDGRREKWTTFAVWLFTLFGSISLASLTVLGPVLRVRSPRLSALIYAVFAPLCHQVPARCFHLAGSPLAVCSRCFGVYLGFVLGTVLYTVLRGFARPVPPPVRTFILACLPIGLDAAGNFLKIWDSPIGLRFTTGVLWGAVVPGYFIAGIHDLAVRILGPRTSPARGRA